MAGRTIIGVDFSGLQQDKNTWITRGKLLSDRKLKIDECRSIRRSDLIADLADRTKTPNDAVAAMDFPFSVPIAFAEYLGLHSSKMPDLWSFVAKMGLDEFIEKRNRFVDVDNNIEYLRAGDVDDPGAFSCLHDTSPNMVPMTFYRMKMLHQLWEVGCRIPPLYKECRDGPSLIETMPGVLLLRFELPNNNYKTKTKTNKGCPRDVRDEILKGLKEKPCPTLQIRPQEQQQCLDNADCLDSLVAAIGAAMWAMDKNGTDFRRPTDDKVTKLRRQNARRQASPQVIKESLTERQAAKREGWIYAPKPVKQ